MKIQVFVRTFPITEAGHMKTEHVSRKFPNHIEAIQALLQKDATFREICADYAKICTWLEDYCRSQSRPSEECDHARQLIRELEVEIIQVLRDAGFHPP